ncbi:MAG: phasin family protein [Ahrensia sp.]|nr:phasin family protein [Ahrensia sp.]
MAKKDKSTFEFPQGVDPSKYLEQLKTMAEEGLSKAKETYEQAQAVFAEAQKEAEAGLSTMQSNSAKISLATLNSARSNTEATFAHMEKLVGVKSISEFMELQTSFLRNQAEMAVDTAKSMQELYSTAATQAAEPVKKAAEKAMDAFKAK